MFNLGKLSSMVLVKTLSIVALFCYAWLVVDAAVADDAATDKIKVLIIDGQNNHSDWPKITAMLKQYLETNGKFSVDIQRSRFTWRGDQWLKDYGLNDGKEYQALKNAKTDPDFKPVFSKYDVVVNNFGYGAADWPTETQTAFTKFISEGGGMVTVHAADNCFPQWREYNEMIGLGGWGRRNEKSGPYVYYNDDGKLIRDKSRGKGGNHGSQHEFKLVLRDSDHPITKGMPKSFMHTKDELYEKLRGPAVNMNILATAYASPEQKGSGRHEPILMAIDYEDGRIFHSTLGHAAYSCEGVGFITTFLRGTEWAATGKVTIEIPDDFPTADKSTTRKFELATAAQQAPNPSTADDSQDEEGFVSLFNEKTLDGWAAARASGEDKWGAFSVNEKEKAIHVYANQEAGSKQQSDCLVSDKSFSHFILKLEYKWLESRFAPRVDHERDAGLLFHVHGNLRRVWPSSLEMQIGESPGDKPRGRDAAGRFHTGDLFILGGNLETETPMKGRFYSENGKRRSGRINAQASKGVEKPKGQWNEMEIHVHGSEKATFIFNGEVVLETFNFTQKDKDGEKSPLTKGHIGLQAEWAELMYRNIRIKELPAE